MEKLIYAKGKYIGKSPRKTRLVIDLIRGKEVDLALDILQFNEKAAALDIRKVLNSAIANAVHNNGMDKKELYVAEARVDEAPSYKRGRPASKGRYVKIIKRNCHIIIGVQNISIRNEAKSKKVTKKGVVSQGIQNEKENNTVQVKSVNKSVALKSTKNINSKTTTK